jgi:hypothetical protein
LALIVLPMAVALSLAHFARRSEPAATSANAAASSSNEWLAHLSSNALAHFLLQLLVVLLAAKGAGWLLRKFGQPAVVGEMAAGLLLGPLLLGSLLPGLQGWLFAPDSLGALGLISQLGVLMFLFVAGAELNLGGLRGHGTALSAGWGRASGKLRSSRPAAWASSRTQTRADPSSRSSRETTRPLR